MNALFFQKVSMDNKILIFVSLKRWTFILITLQQKSKFIFI